LLFLCCALPLPSCGECRDWEAFPDPEGLRLPLRECELGERDEANSDEDWDSEERSSESDK